MYAVNKARNLDHDHAKQSARGACKTVSKRAIQKTAEVTGDFTENKIADKITKVSPISP